MIAFAVCSYMTVWLLQGPPLPCNLGFQSAAGSTECSLCPAGFACPVTSDSSLNFACLPGSFSGEGESVCKACPAGWACPNTSASIACEPGSFSLDGYTKCEPCLAGWACPYTTGHGNSPCILVSDSSYIKTTNWLILLNHEYFDPRKLPAIPTTLSV